jgi:two-component system NtrC family response regulator
VSATHRNLEAMCDSGAFRRDLFYRLNGLTIEIPPLRERRGEIVALAEQFARAAGSKAPISPSAIAGLLEYPWPGNVRELRNMIERACLFAAGLPIDRAHLELPAAKVRPSTLPSNPTPRATAKDDERQRILDALAASNGSQKKAAELLGLSRRAMQHRIEVYKISGPRKTRG